LDHQFLKIKKSNPASNIFKVKQSKWKERVEYIKVEMLKRGKEKSATEILQQFSTRLSATILHFFSESDSFSPSSNLTVAQKAFTHSLQLYDLNSVMRLVVNYDISKGVKVLIPGIDKSFRSLMVVPRLEKFTSNSLESTDLDVYKYRLEEALSIILRCSRTELYEEDIFAEKMDIISSTTKAQREKYFTERLRTLFSSNYRTYLMLKNRYFLNLLFRYRNNSNNLITNETRQKNSSFKIEEDANLIIKKMEEKFDFRSVEQLVKDQIIKNEERDSSLAESNVINSIENFKLGRYSNLEPEDKQNLIPKKNTNSNISINNHNSSNSVELEKFEGAMSAYLKLSAKYAEPLRKMMDSFCPVSECSSPYFRPRAEDYRIEFSYFFRRILGKNLNVIAASQKFILELLIQRGQEYNAAERWGMVSHSKYDEKSIYFRKTEKEDNFLDRKTEWSILIQFCVPFNFQLPMEKGEKIMIEKGKFCLFQIGTAFFDHGHKKNLEESPDVFFKLMFGGHLLTSKNAVIHVENDPYFTTTLSQMWHCRGLVYLFFMALSHRFVIELSSTLKEFLVEVLPETINVKGFIS